MMSGIHAWLIDGAGSEVAERMLDIALGPEARIEIQYHGKPLGLWLCKQQFVEGFQRDCMLFGIAVNVYVLTGDGELKLWRSAPASPEHFFTPRLRGAYKRSDRIVM